MEVIFRNYDGSAEETRKVVPNSRLSKYREALKMLLGLPEKQHCKFFLERTNQELDVNLTFEDAGIQPNETLILCSQNIENINPSEESYQESFSSSPEDTRKAYSSTPPNRENNNSSQEYSQESVSFSPKDTRKTDSSTPPNRENINSSQEPSEDPVSSSAEDTIEVSSPTPTAVAVLARITALTGFKEWQKPAITGGIIGVFILIGLIIPRTSSKTPAPQASEPPRSPPDGSDAQQKQPLPPSNPPSGT